jgi:hypothetical protein
MRVCNAELHLKKQAALSDGSNSPARVRTKQSQYSVDNFVDTDLQKWVCQEGACTINTDETDRSLS